MTTTRATAVTLSGLCSRGWNNFVNAMGSENAPKFMLTGIEGMQLEGLKKEEG